MKDTMKLHFLGAAGTVTGSKYLLDTGQHKIMIDCGLFQGLKELRLLNWDFLPVDVAEIDLVLLTHGHLDHTGYLPKLVKSGYRKSILGTAPTLAIAEIILLDSAKIHEEEAERANKEGFSNHSPALPLYDVNDANRAISRFKQVDEGEWIDLFDGIKARFQYVGHIIGATFIELEVHGKRIVFSGDIGRLKDPLMRPYKRPKKADVLLIESTYGNRLHPTEDVEQQLKSIIEHTVNKGGTLIIPSFAVERTQLLMFYIWKLKEKKLIPDIPLIMDSPMGADVLSVFRSYSKWHELPVKDCEQMCRAFRVIEEYKETWEVIESKKPKLVIAGSGMMSGGRVLTYLQHYLDRPETSILISGFQAEGTRGRKLLEGASELKIFGKQYAVKAELFELHALSAHADQAELLDWMSELDKAPEQMYIVHGEAHAADAFRQKVADTYGWKSIIPKLYDIKEVAMSKLETSP